MFNVHISCCSLVLTILFTNNFIIDRRIPDANNALQEISLSSIYVCMFNYLKYTRKIFSTLIKLMIKSNETFNSFLHFHFIHMNFDTITQRIETNRILLKYQFCFVLCNLFERCGSKIIRKNIYFNQTLHVMVFNLEL